MAHAGWRAFFSDQSTSGNEWDLHRGFTSQKVQTFGHVQGETMIDEGLMAQMTCSDGSWKTPTSPRAEQPTLGWLVF